MTPLSAAMTPANAALIPEREILERGKRAGAGHLHGNAEGSNLGPIPPLGPSV